MEQWIGQIISLLLVLYLALPVYRNSEPVHGESTFGMVVRIVLCCGCFICWGVALATTLMFGNRLWGE